MAERGTIRAAKDRLPDPDARPRADWIAAERYSVGVRTPAFLPEEMGQKAPGRPGTLSGKALGKILE